MPVTRWLPYAIAAAGVITAVVALRSGCSGSCPVTTKADKQLVTTVKELATEHVEAAKTKAVATRTKAAAAAKEEARDEATRGDLVDLLSDRISSAGGD
jgi:outer membrane murein-binding lipoprotein Lpp